MSRISIICGFLFFMVSGKLHGQSDEPKKIYLYVHLHFDEIKGPGDSLEWIAKDDGIRYLKQILAEQLPDKEIMCDTLSHGLNIPGMFSDSNRKSPLMIDGDIRAAWMASVDGITLDIAPSDSGNKSVLTFRCSIWNNRTFKVLLQEKIVDTLKLTPHSDIAKQIMMRIAEPILDAMPGRVKPNEASKENYPSLKNSGKYFKNSVLILSEYKRPLFNINLHYGVSIGGVSDNIKPSSPNSYQNDTHQSGVVSIGAECAVLSRLLFEAGISLPVKYTTNTYVVGGGGAWQTDQTITIKPSFFLNTRYLIAAFRTSRESWFIVSGGTGVGFQTLALKGDQFFRNRSPATENNYKLKKPINDLNFKLLFEYCPLQRLSFQLRLEQHVTSTVKVPAQTLNGSAATTIAPQKMSLSRFQVTGGVEIAILK